MCLSPPEEKSRCEAIGDKVDESISNVFYKIGYFCSFRPKTTIAIGLVVSIICAGGMAKLNTENRPEKLWVPQNTQAEVEQDKFLSYFPPSSRFQNVIASAKETGTNVLTKDNLVDLMKMHESIATGESEVENESYTFADLCTPAGGSCHMPEWTNPICTCLVVSVLKVRNSTCTIFSLLLSLRKDSITILYPRSRCGATIWPDCRRIQT
mmetsp:Transcript_21430/g.45804  ORF Transcript_21430/g.45804 Transcript_21430/m.45804 type:complete len:210 (-) Transcript_21430:1218-1847(-)